MFVLKAMRVAAATLIKILFKKIKLSFFRKKIFPPTYKNLTPFHILIYLVWDKNKKMRMVLSEFIMPQNKNGIRCKSGKGSCKGNTLKYE